MQKARLIDGRAIAQEIIAELQREVAALKKSRGIVPALAVLQIGESPATEVYVRNKVRACEQLGIRAEVVRLPGRAQVREVLAAIAKLNARTDVDGILVQLPLPAHLSEERVLLALDPRKDVDGLHPLNLGNLCAGRPGLVPSAAAAIQELFTRLGIGLSGRHVVVVGRSPTIGKPIALLLLEKDATVTVCHARTHNLARISSEADILVVAVGKPGIIGARHVKPGAVVVDAGINRLSDEAEVRRLLPGDTAALLRFREQHYLLVGDVAQRRVEPIAGYLTPVPGGVGPITVAMLLRNTVRAAAG